MSSGLQTHGESFTTIETTTDKIPTNNININNKIKLQIEDKLNTNNCKNTEDYNNNNNNNNYDNNDNDDYVFYTNDDDLNNHEDKCKENINNLNHEVLYLNNDQIMTLKKYKHNRDIIPKHKESLKNKLRESRRNIQDICVGLDEENELVIIDGHHRVEAMQELIIEEGLIQYTMSARLFEGIWDNDRISTYKVESGIYSRKESGRNIVKYVSSCKDAPRDVVLFNDLLSTEFCGDAKIKLGIGDILECNPFKKIRSAISRRSIAVKLSDNKFRFKGGIFEITYNEGRRLFNTINNITEYAHALDSIECRNKNFKFSTKDGRFMIRFMISFNADMERFSRNYKNSKKCLDHYNNYRSQTSTKNNGLNDWFKFINSIYFTPLQLSKYPTENFAYKYDNDSFKGNYDRFKPFYFEDYKFYRAMSELKSYDIIDKQSKEIQKESNEDSLFNN